jgi:c-di-GMP-binding flagellar brake protein YcgR
MKEFASRRTGSEPEAEGQERRGRRVKTSHRLFFFGENEFEGEATILDVSTGGCQATSLSEVKVGTILKLSMFLHDQPWALRIDESIVRWVKDQTFGLEFIGIRPAQRERLRAILMKDKGSQNKSP